jgi:hypothetical protein
MPSPSVAAAPPFAQDRAHRMAVELLQLIDVSQRPLNDPLLRRMVAAHIRDELADYEQQLIADLRPCDV